nr:ERO1-like protein beta isoform X1 [Hydra vulgaris]
MKIIIYMLFIIQIILFTTCHGAKKSKSGIETTEYSWYHSKYKDADSCLCQLTGKLEDCCCTIEDVEAINSNHIYSKLVDIISHNYFRYIKLNLHRGCPFWQDWGKCAIKNCKVDTCSDEELPPGLKDVHNICSKENKYGKDSQNSKDTCFKDFSNVASNSEELCSVGKEKTLGDIDKTISDQQKEHFKGWSNYDADTSFCVDLEDDVDNSSWIDLTINPERYTGYQGKDANRIWMSIYKENCFLPENSPRNYEEFKAKFLSKTCIEKRVFYRTVSGLHASISIHLSYKYLLQKKSLLENEVWGPNIKEFKKRFDAAHTNGNGPHWLKNVFFTYSVVLRAVIKATPYWKEAVFYTGNSTSDLKLKEQILDFINSTRACPSTFDESVMFTGDPEQAAKLKEEFRLHYKNITRIMDCVGCERCRLWGKLQTTGIGTALKILFSSSKWDVVPVINGKKFSLTRTETVSLFQVLSKLSASVQIISEFKNHDK